MGDIKNSEGSSSMNAQTGSGSSASTDAELDSGRHDRNYNPVNSAEKGSVSAKLNEDSARYLKGPGPV